MNAPQRLRMSAADYLAWEQTQARKHELVDGAVRMMAGGSRAHNLLARNCLVSLTVALRGTPCQPMGSDTKVRTGETSYRYPDVTVDCGAGGPLDQAAAEPRVVIEVLSPSTEYFDLSAKLLEYQAVATIAHVVLLSQRRIQAEVWTRGPGGWLQAQLEGPEAEIALPAIGGTVSLGEIYEGVDLAPDEDPA